MLLSEYEGVSRKKLVKYSEKTEIRGKVGRNKVHGGRDGVNYTVTMISHFRLVC